MARSDYIYVLQCKDGTIMAVRTIKGELVSYTHTCGWSRSLLEEHCHFIRFSDGACPRREPFYYDWEDIPEKKP